MAKTGQYSGPQMCISMLSGAAITKYAPVIITGQDDGVCITSSGATDVCIGIAQNAASAAGESVSVCFIGVSKVKASATITKGVLIQPTGSAGKVKTAVSTGYALGQALEAAAADGDLVSAIIGLHSHLLA